MPGAGHYPAPLRKEFGIKGWSRERRERLFIDIKVMRRQTCRRMEAFQKNPLFFLPEAAEPRSEVGFRFGSVGTHSSRTLMLAELVSVLNYTTSDTERDGYKHSVIDDNCLGKPTSSTRRLSFQRLSELYSLDPQVSLFRLLRRLWAMDAGSQPHLALLVALARDPLLRASAPAVLNLKVGEEFRRADAEDALRAVTDGRLNDSILAKVVRNCASSWAQAGLLQGRTFKYRRQIKPHFVGVTMALATGYLAGFRGDSLFASPWMRVLDADPATARNLALEAKRAGLLDLRISDKIVDLQFERLDPSFASSLSR
jgi:hypothetical protein